MDVADGQLRILKEGKIAKFVEAVDQVSFSGTRATSQGQDVTFVTERGVIRLIDGRLVVTEIAPGLDLDRDLLAQADTPLAVADDLKIMDPRLFIDAPMGLKLDPGA